MSLILCYSANLKKIGAVDLGPGPRPDFWTLRQLTKKVKFIISSQLISLTKIAFNFYSHICFINVGRRRGMWSYCHDKD